MRKQLAAAAAALAALASFVVAVRPATAETTSSTYTFTAPGTYQLAVPAYPIEAVLDGLGAAGFPGDDSATDWSTGGAAGSGTEAHEEVALPAGDTLQIVVGAKGGGGWRGYGSELSGSGGNGGGATYITDLTTGALLLVAGGGGGGGGGGGTWYLYNGGNGGTESDGTPGIGTAGGDAGRGGAIGQPGTCGPSGISQGEAGESAPTGSAVAGGGGGGQGACGAQSGGSGDHGAGAGGGGGGGAGGSLVSVAGWATSIQPGSNAADGSATITFDSYVAHQPVVTSASCIYDSTYGVDVDQPLTASGYPAPNFTLSNQPSWLGIAEQVPAGPDGGTAAFLSATDPAALATPAEYRFQVEASNAVGSVIDPLDLVTGTSSPMFTSPASATATAGVPFSLQAHAIGCPPVTQYALKTIDPATSWLTIDPTTGALSGTPPESAVGSHSVTIQAYRGAGSVPTEQTFTVHVDPVAAGAPTRVTATAGNRTARVAFTAPADNGGAPVTKYTVTATDHTAAARGRQTASGTRSPIVVTGLTDGDRYTFTVTATNAAGTGPASAPSNTVTPAAPSADLAVALHGPSVAHDGRSFTETVTVTNHGPSAATGVTTVVTVPGGLAITAARGATRHGATVTWTTGSLAAHGTVRCSVTVRVGAHSHGRVVFRAHAASAQVHDPHPSNNAASATVTLSR